METRFLLAVDEVACFVFLVAICLGRYQVLSVDGVKPIFQGGLESSHLPLHPLD